MACMQREYIYFETSERHVTLLIRNWTVAQKDTWSAKNNFDQQAYGLASLPQSILI